MAHRKINAAELLTDIKNGMANSQIMEKYQISSATLEKFFQQLVAAGVIDWNAIYARYDECPKSDISQPKMKQKITPKQPEMKRQRKIIHFTFWGLLTWVLGLIFLLTGALALWINISAGISFLILAAVTIPAVKSYFEQKYHFRITAGVQFLLIIAILFGYGIFHHKYPAGDNSISTPASPSASIAPSHEISKAEPTPQSLPMPEIHAIGESVHVGNFAYRVFGSRWASNVGSAILSASPDGHFLVIDIGVVNTDTQPRNIPPFKLIDVDGREFASSSKAWREKNAFGLLESLNPGVGKRGTVVFDIPEGESYLLQLSGGYLSATNALVRLDL